MRSTYRDYRVLPSESQKNIPSPETLRRRMEDESPNSSGRPATLPASSNNNTIIATGPLRLVTLQEPQENFHKDEGGKANQLTFRLILQGELTSEVLNSAAHDQDTFLALNVRPIFDDGELADPSVLEIVGGTEGPHPCIQISTRLGGVRYRLRTVSKRLGNRGIGVVVDVAGCGHVLPLKSETTMVFSKRKNKEQRLEEQARERNELLERQRAAASLLNTRSIGSSGNLMSTVAGLLPPSSMTPSSSALNLTPTQSTTDPSQFVVRLPVGARASTTTTSALRRANSTQDSDSDESFDEDSHHASTSRHRSNSTSSAGGGGKKKPRLSISAASPSLPAASCPTPLSSSLVSKRVEDRLIELETAHERLKQEVDYLRGSIHLHMLQNTRSSSIGSNNGSSINGGMGGNGSGGISQQTVAWEFVDPGDRPNGTHHAGVGGGLLAGMASPPPSRTPLGELETSWGHPPALRRDLSFNSQTANGGNSIE
ncbi:hypothetical protein BASA81_001011 [Batrachochytrium salamandrivorans]|nr:hypothetical protein BASA81_001011 [Batrachochytrium salamandrivorans]